MGSIWLYCAVAFLAGIMVNELIRHLQKSYGTLKIDHSNPEKDSYLFEIENLDDLSKKKFVVLKIDNHADLSQK